MTGSRLERSWPTRTKRRRWGRVVAALALTALLAGSATPAEAAGSALELRPRQLSFGSATQHVDGCLTVTVTNHGDDVVQLEGAGASSSLSHETGRSLYGVAGIYPYLGCGVTLLEEPGRCFRGVELGIEFVALAPGESCRLTVLFIRSPDPAFLEPEGATAVTGILAISYTLPAQSETARVTAPLRGAVEPLYPTGAPGPARMRCVAALRRAGLSPADIAALTVVAGSDVDDIFLPVSRPRAFCGFGGRDTIRDRPYLPPGDIFLGGDGSDGGGLGGRAGVRVEGGTFRGDAGSDVIGAITAGVFVGGRDDDAATGVVGGGVYAGGSGDDVAHRVSGGVFDAGPGNDAVRDLSGGVFDGGVGDDTVVLNQSAGSTFLGGPGDDATAGDGIFYGGPGDDRASPCCGVFFGGSGDDGASVLGGAFFGQAGSDFAAPLAGGHFDGGAGVDRNDPYERGTCVDVEIACPATDAAGFLAEPLMTRPARHRDP